MFTDPQGRSTVARSVMFAQLQRKLADVHGPGEVPMPSRATFYRLMSHLDRGRRNFVSEASRRVSVNRPDRPFTPVTALRPGEDVPIDTNKLDIMCRYADGVVRRAELTMAVDVATRSILGGIIAPTTKAVDAAALLARMLVPEPMRPGWAESLHHGHSAIPHERLLSVDERFANAAAKPVIIPETINCDRGKVYLSETFIRACATLGMSVQPARPLRCRPARYPPAARARATRQSANRPRPGFGFLQRGQREPGRNLMEQAADPRGLLNPGKKAR